MPSKYIYILYLRPKTNSHCSSVKWLQIKENVMIICVHYTVYIYIYIYTINMYIWKNTTLYTVDYSRIICCQTKPLPPSECALRRSPKFSCAHCSDVVWLFHLETSHQYETSAMDQECACSVRMPSSTDLDVNGGPHCQDLQELNVANPNKS